MRSHGRMLPEEQTIAAMECDYGTGNWWMLEALIIPAIELEHGMEQVGVAWELVLDWWQEQPLNSMVI